MHLNTFQSLIENKEQYIKTSGKMKNYLNRIIGDLSNTPLIIHTPDYPDRYKPYWKRFSFIFLSKYCHWRQVSNSTHTFLLESKTIKKFEKYIKDSSVGPSDSKLSEKLYGRIFFNNKALCISPIRGTFYSYDRRRDDPFSRLAKKYVEENINLMKKGRHLEMINALSKDLRQRK